MAKEQYYGLEAETEYKKGNEMIALKYPKIKINGLTLEEARQYPITILKPIQERIVESNGKKYTFYNAFVKYTGTDYAFSAEVYDILGKQLKQYPAQTELILTKDWVTNKKGHKVPTVKVEMANKQLSTEPSDADQKEFLNQALKSFTKTESRHTKNNWLSYYEQLNGGILTPEEEEEAIKAWEEYQKKENKV